MSAPPTIEIALATWNGARFLPALLDSLFAQTCQDFSLVVADDGSTDDTLQLIADYQARHPGRVALLAFDAPAGGAGANFARLIERLSAPYVMFCDQDDVWLPDKVALSLAALRRMEAKSGPRIPLLFYTDLRVVDQALNELDPSFWAYCKIAPRNNDFAHLLMRNVATGCSMMVNRALIDRARPVPPHEVMYDVWIGLIAAAFGAIDYSAAPALLYRQHASNVIGATRWGFAHTLRRAFASFTGENAGIVDLKSRGAALFLERFGPALSPADRRAAEALAHVWTNSRRRRLADLMAGRLRMWSTASQLGLAIALLGKPRPHRRH